MSDSTAALILKERAVATISRALNVKPEQVSLSTGNSGVGIGIVGETDTAINVTIRVQSGRADMLPVEAEAQFRAGLGNIPAIASRVQTEKRKTHGSAIVAKLKAVTEGTDFDTRLYEWNGFTAQASEHALLGINKTAYGLTFSMLAEQPEGVDVSKEGLKLDTNIEARLPAIRESLCARMLHYTRENLAKQGKSEAEIATALEAAKTAFDKLVFHVNQNGTNSVHIAIRSPEQQAAHEKTGASDVDYGWKDVPDNADMLKASNPLMALEDSFSDKTPNPQLHKALARAFLYAGKGMKDLFPKIAGIMDMKIELTDELNRIATQHPDRKAAIDALLADEVFKGRWEVAKQDKAKPVLYISKDSAAPGQQDGSIQASFSLQPEELQACFREMASQAVGQVSQNETVGTPANGNLDSANDNNSPKTTIQAAQIADGKAAEEAIAAGAAR